jgi:hypothetical protein
MTIPLIDRKTGNIYDAPDDAEAERQIQAFGVERATADETDAFDLQLLYGDAKGRLGAAASSAIAAPAKLIEGLSQKGFGQNVDELEGTTSPGGVVTAESIVPFAFDATSKGQRAANPGTAMTGGMVPDLATGLLIPGAGLVGAVAAAGASGLLSEGAQAVIDDRDYSFQQAGINTVIGLGIEGAGALVLHGGMKAAGVAKNYVDGAVSRMRGVGADDALDELDPLLSPSKLVKNQKAIYERSQATLDESVAHVREKLDAAPDATFSVKSLKKTVSENVDAQAAAMSDLTANLRTTADVSEHPELVEIADALSEHLDASGPEQFAALRDARRAIGAFGADSPLVADAAEALDASLRHEPTWGKAASDYGAQLDDAVEDAAPGVAEAYRVHDIGDSAEGKAGRDAIEQLFAKAKRHAAATGDDALLKSIAAGEKALDDAGRVTGAKLMGSADDEVELLRAKVAGFKERAPKLADELSGHLAALDTPLPGVPHGDWSKESVEALIQARLAGYAPAEEALKNLATETDRAIAALKTSGKSEAAAAKSTTRLKKLRDAVAEVEDIPAATRAIRDYDASPGGLLRKGKKLSEDALDDAVHGSARDEIEDAVGPLLRSGGATLGGFTFGVPGAVVGYMAGRQINRTFGKSISRYAWKVAKKRIAADAIKHPVRAVVGAASAALGAEFGGIGGMVAGYVAGNQGARVAGHYAGQGLQAAGRKVSKFVGRTEKKTIAETARDAFEAEAKTGVRAVKRKPTPSGGPKGGPPSGSAGPPSGGDGGGMKWTQTAPGESVDAYLERMRAEKGAAHVENVMGKPKKARPDSLGKKIWDAAKSAADTHAAGADTAAAYGAGPLKKATLAVADRADDIAIDIVELGERAGKATRQAASDVWEMAQGAVEGSGAVAGDIAARAGSSVKRAGQTAMDAGLDAAEGVAGFAEKAVDRSGKQIKRDWGRLKKLYREAYGSAGGDAEKAAFKAELGKMGLADIGERAARFKADLPAADRNLIERLFPGVNEPTQLENSAGLGGKMLAVLNADLGGAIPGKLGGDGSERIAKTLDQVIKTAQRDGTAIEGTFYHPTLMDARTLGLIEADPTQVFRSPRFLNGAVDHSGAHIAAREMASDTGLVPVIFHIQSDRAVPVSALEVMFARNTPLQMEKYVPASKGKPAQILLRDTTAKAGEEKWGDVGAFMGSAAGTAAGLAAAPVVGAATSPILGAATVAAGYAGGAVGGRRLGVEARRAAERLAKKAKAPLEPAWAKFGAEGVKAAKQGANRTAHALLDAAKDVVKEDPGKVLGTAALMGAGALADDEHSGEGAALGATVGLLSFFLPNGGKRLLGEQLGEKLGALSSRARFAVRQTTERVAENNADLLARFARGETPEIGHHRIPHEDRVLDTANRIFDGQFAQSQLLYGKLNGIDPSDIPEDVLNALEYDIRHRNAALIEGDPELLRLAEVGQLDALPGGGESTPARAELSEAGAAPEHAPSEPDHAPSVMQEVEPEAAAEWRDRINGAREDIMRDGGGPDATPDAVIERLREQHVMDPHDEVFIRQDLGDEAPDVGDWMDEAVSRNAGYYEGSEDHIELLTADDIIRQIENGETSAGNHDVTAWEEYHIRRSFDENQASYQHQFESEINEYAESRAADRESDGEGPDSDEESDADASEYEMPEARGGARTNAPSPEQLAQFRRRNMRILQGEGQPVTGSPDLRRFGLPEPGGAVSMAERETPLDIRGYYQGPPAPPPNVLAVNAERFEAAGEALGPDEMGRELTDTLGAMQASLERRFITPGQTEAEFFAAVHERFDSFVEVSEAAFGPLRPAEIEYAEASLMHYAGRARQAHGDPIPGGQLDRLEGFRPETTHRAMADRANEALAPLSVEQKTTLNDITTDHADTTRDVLQRFAAGEPDLMLGRVLEGPNEVVGAQLDNLREVWEMRTGQPMPADVERAAIEMLRMRNASVAQGITPRPLRPAADLNQYRAAVARRHGDIQEPRRPAADRLKPPEPIPPGPAGYEGGLSLTAQDRLGTELDEVFDEMEQARSEAGHPQYAEADAQQTWPDIEERARRVARENPESLTEEQAVDWAREQFDRVRRGESRYFTPAFGDAPGDDRLEEMVDQAIDDIAGADHDARSATHDELLDAIENHQGSALTPERRERLTELYDTHEHDIDRKIAGRAEQNRADAEPAEFGQGMHDDNLQLMVDDAVESLAQSGEGNTTLDGLRAQIRHDRGRRLSSEQDERLEELYGTHEYELDEKISTRRDEIENEDHPDSDPPSSDSRSDYDEPERNQNPVGHPRDPNVPDGLPDDQALADAGLTNVVVRHNGGVEHLFGQALDTDDVKKLLSLDALKQYGADKGYNVRSSFTVEHGRAAYEAHAGDFNIVTSYVRSGDRLQIYTGSLTVPTSLQDNGTGKKIIGDFFNVLERAGSGRVTMTGAAVGKFAWPKLGCRPPPGAEQAAKDSFLHGFGPLVDGDAALVQHATDRIQNIRDLADYTVPLDALRDKLPILKQSWEEWLFHNKSGSYAVKQVPFADAFIKTSKTGEEKFSAGKAFLLMQQGEWNSNMSIDIAPGTDWYRDFKLRLGATALVGGLGVHELLSAMTEGPITAAGMGQADPRAKQDRSRFAKRTNAAQAQMAAQQEQQDRADKVEQTRQKLGYLAAQGRASMTTTARSLASPGKNTRIVPRVPGVTASQGVARFLGDNQSLREAFDTKRESLLALQKDPMLLVDDLSEGFSELAESAPGLHSQVVAQTFKVAKFLQSKLPATIGASLSRPAGVPPNLLAVRQFALYYSAATDPSSVLGDLANNRARKEQVDTLKELWPETYQNLKVGILEQMTKARPTVAQRVRLDILFDFGDGLDTGLSWRVAEMAQKGAEAAQKDSAQGKAMPTRKTQPSVQATSPNAALALSGAAGGAGRALA